MCIRVSLRAVRVGQRGEDVEGRADAEFPTWHGRMSLESLANTADEAALAQAVQLLARADTLHVVGLRRAFPVATYLAYVFEKMEVPAMLHDGVGRLDHRFALRANEEVYKRQT